jgi:hypothetical protein
MQLTSDIGKLQPRWDGQLKPFFARVDAPPPLDEGQEGKHEVELLLNSQTVRWVTR